MPKFVLLVLIALSLVATSVVSLLASPVQLPLQHTTDLMSSPISPLPTQTGSNSSDSSHDSAPFNRTGSISSDVVWLPQADANQLWLKTHQIGVGWWDANGQLHVVLQVNGLVKIPQSAIMISIPRDAAGILAPPGWKKMMRPENGEWVIVRIT